MLKEKLPSIQPHINIKLVPCSKVGLITIILEKPCVYKNED